MTIRTSVAPSAREWAEQKALELSKLTAEELVELGYEEAAGYDRGTMIGIIIACDAPMTEDEALHGDPYTWNYTIMIKEDRT